MQQEIIETILYNEQSLLSTDVFMQYFNVM